MSLVSIIIPCHNSEEFIVETLETVLNQIYTKYEIILVDDGSIDGTVDIIKSYGNKVRAILSDHRGASAARNKGTELANGEFIQYLDSDDLLTSDALEKRVGALLSSGADVAYSDWQKLEEQEDGSFQLGETIARRIEDIHPDPEIACFTSFWCPPAALIYRRSIVEVIGGWNESLPIIQDARFLLDAALHGAKFVYVPGVGARYRVHKNESLSKKSQYAFVKDCFINACQIEELWRKNSGLSLKHKEALLQVYDYTARTLFMYDNDLFKQNLNRLYEIKPNFQFSLPKVAGLTSKFIGFKASRWLARTTGKAPI